MNLGNALILPRDECDGPVTTRFRAAVTAFGLSVDRLRDVDNSHAVRINAIAMHDQMFAAYRDALPAWQTGKEAQPPELHGILARLREINATIRTIVE